MSSQAQAIAHTRPTHQEIDAELIQQLRQQLGLIHRDEYCALTRRTVRAVKRDWTMRRGPKPIRIGMEVFYKTSDVQKFIDECAKRTA